MKTFYRLIAIIFALSFSSLTFAEGWCDLDSGWELVTNGTKADNVWILGKLKNQSNSIWIAISDGNIGKVNVSMALAAEMSGKNLSIYLDSATDTCQTFQSWAPMGKIRHIRIIK